MPNIQALIIPEYWGGCKSNPIYRTHINDCLTLKISKDINNWICFKELESVTFLRSLTLKLVCHHF